MFFVFWLFVYSRAAEGLEMSDILKELTWPLRLKILDELTPGSKVPHIHKSSFDIVTTKQKPTTQPVQISMGSKPPGNLPTIEKSSSTSPIVAVTTPITSSTSPQTTTSSNLTSEPLVKSRRVGIQSLREGRRANEEEDDKDMRLKLFRLMYETVRDSDLKVKRAELIKDHYANSTVFEIGYLIGEITDKANVITDISATVHKFQRDWKPIEHINAYEQISNQAVEITHLIGLVRVLHKKNDGDKTRK